ncbi:rho guanine nucleotide exchange factor 1-like isoform X4 [Polyodon spathula]|uniref:rho guanine nucleotide exchange factor 1-like isoform X4 n=1 Tax=Polyodon spathula TaxID=7913 RepID=UPI001B7DCCF4|nr:rho guanine nucleotide exchange factor 1-like isoform X4 [Polyodon spathula]
MDSEDEARANPAMNIIGAEDEYFENDIDPSVDDQCSHFQSIELLKERPTHLLVFLQHVILQFDCAPLLCYLHADLFRNLNNKEAKKHFVDFYHNFLDKGAVLRVQIPQNVSFELDRTRPELFSEEQQKKFVREVQTLQAQELLVQLDDFRQKRMMGMTPCELELSELESIRSCDRATQEARERAIAEQLLEKLGEIQPSICNDEDKGKIQSFNSSMFSAVVSYMKHLGVKSKSTDSKKSRGFFRKKIPGMKKFDDHSKGSNKRFPSILADTARWIGGSTEKDRLNTERKNSALLPVKPDSSQRSGGKPVGGGETGEVSTVTISITSSGDSNQVDTAQGSFRPDGSGDPSDQGWKGGAVWDPPTPNETPPEEGALESDRKRKRHGVRLGRSESLCAPERRRSQKGSSQKGKQPRSRSDVDLQAASKANSLQRAGSTTQPATPEPGGVGEPPQSFLLAQSEETEPRVSELDLDPPNWREQADPEHLLGLKKTEVKRQEVINELFITEHAHVRMLNVLHTVFYLPLEREKIMSLDELAAIFPGLEDIIEVHNSFYESLKKLRQQSNYIVMHIGETLLSRFNGSEGEWFQKLSSRFSSHQSYALDQIKARQKKDSKFNSFILEAESNAQCRRLQLKDIIPIEMQRLTKYPLLLENIAKCTDEPEEKSQIQQAAECCRKILNRVNQTVREMENLLRLNDYQRRLDLSSLKQSNDPLLAEFKNVDLTQRHMIHEGALTWRVTKEKSVDVQVLLLTDILVLLQKQDDKMLLKCQSKSGSVAQDGKQVLSPIIKLNSVFCREVATDRKAFYVIFTWDCGAQIYELVAQTVSERKNWGELIKNTVEDLKRSGLSAPQDKRVSRTAVLPTSPSYISPRSPLSISENGGSAKDPEGPLHHSDKEKDSLSEKVGNAAHLLVDFLTANGIDPYSMTHAPQEKVASEALQEVLSLKRMLVGSICLSEEVALPPEGTQHAPSPEDEGSEKGSEGRGEEEEAAESGRREEDCGSQSAGGAQANSEPGGEEGEESISTPLVLSHDQAQEVGRRVASLERQLQQLKIVEEEYHRLQDGLSKFAMSQHSY